MDDFTRLQEFLFNEDMGKNEALFTDTTYRRLANALTDSNGTGLSDLANLVRGVLRQEAERMNSADSPLLRVPVGKEWPTEEIWHEAGVEVLQVLGNEYVIRAHRWNPKWLNGADVYPPDQPLYSREIRSRMEPVHGDPFLQLVDGRTHYRCKGQRDAIRSLLSAPSDATLVINLPTGAGKSLCAQLPALLTPSPSLTIVVVPTTSLAYDQERSMKSLIPHPTAYYGGADKEAVKRGIRERIKDGSQRIVFTSPESLLQSLFDTVQGAAERGELAWFVIDEAHIVDQWGDEFRSSFQELAGWRRHMLRKSPVPFRTLLLSATITESCLDTLETLFGQDGPFDIYSAVHLRPEPSFWSHKCTGEELRIKQVLEAIAHLPRPLILYTSTVADAEHWEQLLKGNGYFRTAIVTGKTGDMARSETIERWQDRQVDIVVATSAFGMGVDQAEVRAVLHACIPESVDRFYQEVGRGGRDGYASISLVLYTEEDKRIAESLNSTKIIGIERGRQRWQRMFDTKVMLPEQDRIRVFTNISPSVEGEEIDMNNARNLAWNVRTLTLMCRAGLIEFDWEDLKIDEELGHNSSLYRTVRIINHDHLSLETWKGQIQEYRIQSQKADQRNLELMYEVLDGDRCAATIFKELYSIPKREGEEKRREVSVLHGCGGCAFCRNAVKTTSASVAERWPIAWEQRPALSQFLQKRFDLVSKPLVIYYGELPIGGLKAMSLHERLSWMDRLFWFVKHGVLQFVGDKSFLQVVREDDFKRLEKRVLFLSEMGGLLESFAWPKVPTLLFHPPSKSLDFVVQGWVKSNEGNRILLLPEGVEDPQKPGRRLRDRVDGLSITEFYKEVGL